MKLNKNLTYYYHLHSLHKKSKNLSLKNTIFMWYITYNSSKHFLVFPVKISLNSKKRFRLPNWITTSLYINKKYLVGKILLCLNSYKLIYTNDQIYF